MRRPGRFPLLVGQFERLAAALAQDFLDRLHPLVGGHLLGMQRVGAECKPNRRQRALLLVGPLATAGRAGRSAWAVAWPLLLARADDAVFVDARRHRLCEAKGSSGEPLSASPTSEAIDANLDFAIDVYFEKRRRTSSWLAESFIPVCRSPSNSHGCSVYTETPEITDPGPCSFSLSRSRAC